MMETKGMTNALSFLLSMVGLAFRKHVCLRFCFFYFSWLERWCLIMGVPFPLMILIVSSNISTINDVLGSYFVSGAGLSTFLDP